MVEDVKADIVASQFRPQIQRASLFVTILDINDNNPEFKEKLYKVMLQENLPKNTGITICCIHFDTNLVEIRFISPSVPSSIIVD